jgi:hypothetical protein
MACDGADGLIRLPAVVRLDCHASLRAPPAGSNDSAANGTRISRRVPEAFECPTPPESGLFNGATVAD